MMKRSSASLDARHRRDAVEVDYSDVNVGECYKSSPLRKKPSGTYTIKLTDISTCSPDEQEAVTFFEERDTVKIRLFSTPTPSLPMYRPPCSSKNARSWTTSSRLRC